jgi:hypothetical protein
LYTLVNVVEPGDRYATGDLKGADFIQFYALAHVAYEGSYPTVADTELMHRRQAELIPASSATYFMPVYPPTAALFFAPLRLFSYSLAFTLWSVTTVLGYVVIVWTLWRYGQDAIPDGRFVTLAALAFHPVWMLILHGQSTMLPLMGFFLSWLALEHRRQFLAGLALALVTVKPQFGIVIAATVLLGGPWRMLAGAVLAVAAMLGAVTLTMGGQALTAYAETLRGLASVQQLLEPQPWRMHSLRSLTSLLPLGDALWVSLAAGVVAIAVYVWRLPTALGPRFAVVLFATVLVNPHLFHYDATILALPLILAGHWMERERSAMRDSYWQAVYALFVLLLFPTARLVHVQGSVVVLLWMFIALSLNLRRQTRIATGIASKS